MFKLTHKLPKKYWIACSGGVDSMSALHFLATRSNEDSLIGIVHVNHGTEFSDRAQELVTNVCGKKYDKPVLAFSIDRNQEKSGSLENWWRNKRYEFFSQVPGKDPIILAHNFDDCLEEYIMCVMVRGRMGSIPYKHERCIRPFRLWKKKSIIEYAKRNSLQWIEDPSNVNIKYKRNYIRNKIVPGVLELNCGVYNLVERAIKQQDKWDKKV